MNRRCNFTPRMLAGFIIALAAMRWGVASGQTPEGEIRGRATVTANDDLTEELMRGRSLTRYTTHVHSSNESVPPYRLSEKAVIYLESVPAGSAAYLLPETNPQLNQTQMLFRPLVLAVLAGTAVDFPNNDNLFHNVFSYSQPREFDLGRYHRGHRRSIYFDAPGVVKVYCDIHSYMYATILVLENPYYTTPNDDGTYSITGIPPGSYRLCFWYGRKKAETRPVTIEDGKTTFVNFEY